MAKKLNKKLFLIPITLLTLMVSGGNSSTFYNNVEKLKTPILHRLETSLDGVMDISQYITNYNYSDNGMNTLEMDGSNVFDSVSRPGAIAITMECEFDDSRELEDMASLCAIRSGEEVSGSQLPIGREIKSLSHGNKKIYYFYFTLADLPSELMDALETGGDLRLTLPSVEGTVTINEFSMFHLMNESDDFNSKIVELIFSNLDTNGPLISGANVSYFTNVESPISVDAIKAKLTAWDETDGNVSDSIKIAEDNYTGHERELGAHTVKFEASDLSGNKSYLTVTINVRDVTAPIINGPDTLTYSYDDIISEDQFLLNYSATDNTDNSPSLTLSYTTNIFDKENEIGNYTVTINCSDASGNSSTKEVHVLIEDKKPPVITGPETITKRTSVVLTAQDILEQFSATDDYDGSCEVYIIEDNYSGHGDEKGQYTIKIGAKDKSNNIGEKVVTIDVIDDIAPVWYVDKTLIYVDQSITLSQQDIINLMIQTGEITNDYSVVQIQATEYLESPNTPGKYQAKILVKYANGEQLETIKTIEVLDESDRIPVEKTNLWDKIVAFFVMIWEKILVPIGNFFKNIFNKIFG